MIYLRELFRGKTYGQLQPAEQAQVNERVLRERATWTIQATEQGIFRINPRTGQTLPVAPSRAVAPTTSAPVTGSEDVTGLATQYRALRRPEVAKQHVDEVLANPQSTPGEKQLAVRAFNEAFPQAAISVPEAPGAPTAPATGGTAPKAPVALVPYENLSPFAKSVSEEEKPKAFGAKPPTEGQSKALSFGSQALQAQEVIRDLEENTQEFGNTYGLKARNIMRNLSVAEAAGLGGAIGLVGGLPGAAVGGAVGVAVKIATPLLNAFDSDAQRAYLQAKLNWMSAVLRKESGAAIGISEFVSTDERYFPQPGESPEVIANKTRAREQAIRGLQTEAGSKLMPPQVVPFPKSSATPQSGAAPSPAQGMLNLMGRALPGAAPALPEKVLPVPPQAQERNAPGAQPKATETLDRLDRLQLVGPMKSDVITSGAADEHLKAIGYDALMTEHELL